MLSLSRRHPRTGPFGLAAAAAATLLMTAALLAPRAQAAETVNVEIADFAFDPATVTVQIGDTVTWTNNDSTAHTATSTDDPALFDGEMEPGDSFSFTFTEAGTFDYICEFHPDMQGTIVVEAAAASPGASQVPDGAMAAASGGGTTPAVLMGLALMALSLLLWSVAAWRRARSTT